MLWFASCEFNYVYYYWCLFILKLQTRSALYKYTDIIQKYNFYMVSEQVLMWPFLVLHYRCQRWQHHLWSFSVFGHIQLPKPSKPTATSSKPAYLRRSPSTAISHVHSEWLISDWWDHLHHPLRLRLSTLVLHQVLVFGFATWILRVRFKQTLLSILDSTSLAS